MRCGLPDARNAASPFPRSVNAFSTASSQQSARSIRSAAVEFGRGQILDLDRSRSLRSDLFTVPLCPQRRVFPGSRLGMPVITRQSEGMAACAVVTQVGDVRCSAADLLVISKVRQPDAGAASESVGPVEAVEHQVGLFVGEASPCRAGEVGLDLPVDQKAYLGDSTTSILTNTGGTGDEMPRRPHDRNDGIDEDTASTGRSSWGQEDGRQSNPSPRSDSAKPLVGWLVECEYRDEHMSWNGEPQRRGPSAGKALGIMGPSRERRRLYSRDPR